MMKTVTFACPHIAFIWERHEKDWDPVPERKKKKKSKTVNLGFVLGFVVLMGFVQLMPATSGAGSVSGHIAIKGGSVGWASLQEEAQEAEQ